MQQPRAAAPRRPRCRSVRPLGHPWEGGSHNLWGTQAFTSHCHARPSKRTRTRASAEAQGLPKRPRHVHMTHPRRASRAQPLHERNSGRPAALRHQHLPQPHARMLGAHALRHASLPSPSRPPCMELYRFELNPLARIGGTWPHRPWRSERVQSGHTLGCRVYNTFLPQYERVQG